MKKITIFKVLPFVVLSIVLSSCLKDDLYTADTDEAVNTIEFSDPDQAADAEHIYPVFEQYFEVVPSAEGSITVSYSGGKPAPQDIVVDVQIDQSALSKYNARIVEVAREAAIAAGEDPDEAEYYAQADFYDLMPTSLYTLSSNQVTIKKGESKATIKVSTKPDQYDFAYRYVLPLTISSASMGTISGTFKTVFYYFGALNEWDGTYKYTTSANTSLVPNANKNVKLLTAGAYKLKLSPGLLGTYSNEVIYTIDPATNAVTVECPSLGVQTPQDTRSKYDPATKTFTVFWKQGNGGRTFEETFVYSGPR